MRMIRSFILTLFYRILFYHRFKDEANQGEEVEDGSESENKGDVNPNILGRSKNSSPVKRKFDSIAGEASAPSILLRSEESEIVSDLPGHNILPAVFENDLD